MKGSFNLKKTLGQKNIILAVVALVLIVMTVIGSTFSWIEEVSHVEFNSTDGQKTPAHIGAKILKSDAAINEKNAASTINLNEYFLKSGDAHLSPCYSNGEDFYFPVEKITTGGTTSYRSGTKDDANVSYMSATFRVRSEGMGCVFWFEKSKDNNSDVDYITCEKTDNDVTTSVNLNKYLRVSVSVDGATNVYALDTNGKFKTIEGNDHPAPVEKTARRIDQYTYYDEEFTNNNLPDTKANDAKPNQGSKTEDGEYNLNGNTVFSVPKYDDSSTESKTNTTKTVNIKLWLEYDAQNNATRVDVSKLNLNLVSSWSKERRIYIKDSTVHQKNYTQAHWLPTNSATLYWGIQDDIPNKCWNSTRIGSTVYYYQNIKAVYNNIPSVLFRCNSSGGGSRQYKTTGKYYWDMWETTFPNTFHSEVFSVYSTDFATWNDDVKCVYIVNSSFFTNMFDYMWDSNSVYGSGINDKVVMNANWPGIKMTTKMAKKTSSKNLDTYAFFYNSDYDRIIFNDGDLVSGANQEYQTQNLWLTDNEINKTFDMATLTWFSTNPTNTSVWDDSNHSVMPHYSDDNTYLYSNMSTNNAWKKTRFAYGGSLSGTSSSKMICKFYNKVSAPSNRIYFKKPDSWSGIPKAYIWNSSSNNHAAAWPGTTMTLQGADIYYVTIPTGTWNRVQFNDGTNDNKIDNLTVTGGKMYDNGSWKTHVSDYEMKLVNNGTFYGAYGSSDHRLFPGGHYTLSSDSNHQDNLIIKELKDKTVYRFYFEWDNGNPKISLAEGE